MRWIVPAAILVAGVAVAAAILVAPLVAPYRFVTRGQTIWRVNIVTGEGVSCEVQDDTDREKRRRTCVIVRSSEMWDGIPPRR